MIILSIVLCLFANLIRLAELYDLTNVQTLKDYFRYNKGISITYNLTWILITFVVWCIVNIPLKY